MAYKTTKSTLLSKEMLTNLELKSLNAQDLITMYVKLRANYNKVYSELNHYKMELEQLTGKINSNAENKALNNYINGYKDHWAGVEKVIYILKFHKKALFTKEFDEELIRLDENHANKANSYKATAKILYDAEKNGRIIQHKRKGVKSNSYALPEWFDENKVLLKKYDR